MSGQSIYDVTESLEKFDAVRRTKVVPHLPLQLGALVLSWVYFGTACL